MSVRDMIEIAQSQVGYLEKATNANLESFTGNAGRNNYTKYGAWYGMNGQPWCDMFISWCADQVGETKNVGKYAYVPSHVAFFKQRGQYFTRGAKTPRAGDIIFFGDADHIGLVENVSNGYVYTIEGNTSGTSGLIANGGGVCRKSYSLTSGYIMGYGRPSYFAASSQSAGKTEKFFNPWKVWKNGSTEEPVYKDTDRTVKTGNLNPYESCYCAGVYGDSYLVAYKLDGTTDDWAVGYVKYDGGVV